MKAERAFHVAALLRSGEILVAGGFADTGTVRGVERFDPATNRWRRTVPLRGARGHAAIAVLREGVLVAGGGLVSGRIVPSAEIYDAG
jgi:hypothetical protein